jgi:hypothetical protein
LCKFELYLCEFDLFVCSVRFIFVRVRIIFVRFNLFLCGSILFRELQHIATVLYINIMNITNFDRNGTPYLIGSSLAVISSKKVQNKTIIKHAGGYFTG